jgi:sarcosine oxidase, subunit gamma
MAEPLLQSPLHSLGLPAKARRLDRSCGVWANELEPLGYISLRGDSRQDPFVATASRVLGTALPTEPCTHSTGSETTILWLSPDEWMVICPRDRAVALARSLAKELAGIHSAVTLNSGGFTQIYLAGSDADRVLSHCTVYDLSKLTAGRVVGTTFGKSSIYLRRTQDAYYLLVRRSFADYVWKFLERAAVPYGLGIALLDGSSPSASGASA